MSPCLPTFATCLFTLTTCTRAPESTPTHDPTPPSSAGASSAGASSAGVMVAWRDLAARGLAAFDGQVVTLRGALWDGGHGLSLTEDLRETMPPRPAGASVPLHGLDPVAVAPWMLRAVNPAVAWSRRDVLVVGRVVGPALVVLRASEHVPPPFAWAPPRPSP